MSFFTWYKILSSGKVNNCMKSAGNYHDNQSISNNFKFIQISKCVSNLMDN
jgi:hypothetical protein